MRAAAGDDNDAIRQKLKRRQVRKVCEMYGVGVVIEVHTLDRVRWVVLAQLRSRAPIDEPILFWRSEVTAASESRVIKDQVHRAS